MPVDDDALEDDDVRQTYNFAPGYHGIVYRADVPDYGAGPSSNEHTNAEDNHDGSAESPMNDAKEIRYKLQAMKWGTSLICFVIYATDRISPFIA